MASSSRGTIMTRAKSGQLFNQANQAKAAVISAPDRASFASGSLLNTLSTTTQTSVSKPGRPVPQMPILTDARDDDGLSEQGDSATRLETSRAGASSGKIQRGRQRTGSVSSHAVYARLNRERKKKYLVELEQYRRIMKKKSVESRKELADIHKETVALIHEIASLRNELVGNDSLMSLLASGRIKS